MSKRTDEICGAGIKVRPDMFPSCNSSVNKKMPVLVYLRETLIAVNRADAARIAAFYVCGALVLACLVYHVAALFL